VLARCFVLNLWLNFSSKSTSAGEDLPKRWGRPFVVKSSNLARLIKPPISNLINFTLQHKAIIMASIQTDLHGNRLSNSPPHSKDGGQTSETDGEEEDTPSCVIKNPYKKRTTTLQHPPSHQDEIKEHCSPPFTDDDDDDNISEMEDLLKSSSTNQSRRGAVVHFDRFADVSKSCKFDNLDPSSTNFDLEAISEKFCIYLLELKMDNGNYYAADSLPQFLSGWVNALKKKKEFNAFLKSPSSLDWYKNMWSDLRTRARTNAFYRGDTAKHNKCYLRRHTVAKITMFYLKNPVRKQDSKGWEDM